MRVLLVFARSASGVDGPRSVFGDAPVSRFTKFKDSVLQRLIQRAQFAVPPMALMVLSSIEVEGVEQRICDMRFDELPLDERWDLVGITVHTGAAREAFDVARRFRARGTKVVLGGPHVTLFPDLCANEADSLVIGEADDLWRVVLEDLKRGALKARYQSDALPDLSIYRPVSKRALDIKRYFTTNLIQTSRGCPYRCDFCNVYVMNGNRSRHRPIEHVVAEVERFLKEDKRIFFFVDDTINADRAYATELFTKLIPYKIQWVGQATTLLGQQPEVLEAFAKSGCKGLLLGIEGVTDAANHSHRKFQNKENALVRNVKAIRQAGICVYGSFIYGLDGDTLETPRRLYDFIEETEIDVPGINVLRPIPGTALFDRLAAEGRLMFPKDDIYAFRYSWGQELLCKPKNISIEDFIESYCDLTKKLFTFKNAFKRALNAPAIPHAILMFNLAYIQMYGLSRRDLRQQLSRLKQTSPERSRSFSLDAKASPNSAFRL
ncbi:MAG: B12-binding domain-containing radical SAM protein [Chloroherpetonaceae bacterium]|nr:B12-binding domain-containing radical SAM protein [Chloroherpetonaceae bacterium]MDW8438195.1 radical SAM protein [Chloroherpetonaceae bacterium]